MIVKGPTRTLTEIAKTLGKYASIASAIVCVFSIVYTVKEVADNKAEIREMRSAIAKAELSCALTESSVRSHREMHEFLSKKGCF